MASSSQEIVSGPQRRLESKQLLTVRSLGKGLSGFIYETTWLGSRYTRKDFPLGSVKRNYVFEKEAKSLFNLDHPNIVKSFGYTVGKSSCSLLLEYVEDAHDLQITMEKRTEAQRKMELVSSGSTSRSRVLDVEEIERLISSKVEEIDSEMTDVDVSSKTSESKTPFELQEAVDIMLQIATGMEYLHNNEIAHGDLKPNNVLIYSTPDRMILAKVTDFGLIETKKRIKLVSKRTRHFEALMWKAPERLYELLGPLTKNSDDPFTESDTGSDEELESPEDFKTSRLAMADVYSFGLTCSHILGAELMCPSLILTQLREQRMRGFKPELPLACPEYLKYIINSSLEREPSNRLTFSGICTLLSAALRSKQLPRPIKDAAGRAGGHGPSRAESVLPAGSRADGMSTSTKSCAPCKYQRRKCTPDCPLSPYFPADQPKRFQNVHKLFGVSNVLRILKHVDPSKREDAVKSMAYEADAREKDPVHGSLGIITILQNQVSKLKDELAVAREQMYLLQQQHNFNQQAQMQEIMGSLGGSTALVNVRTAEEPDNILMQQLQQYNSGLNLSWECFATIDPLPISSFEPYQYLRKDSSDQIKPGSPSTSRFDVGCDSK